MQLRAQFYQPRIQHRTAVLCRALVQIRNLICCSVIAEPNCRGEERDQLEEHDGAFFSTKKVGSSSSKLSQMSVPFRKSQGLYKCKLLLAVEVFCFNFHSFVSRLLRIKMVSTSAHSTFS